MIARLILALMLAVFALPAMASANCHGESPSSAHGTGKLMPHHAPAPVPEHETSIAAHFCLGCIPPDTLARPTTVRRVAADDLRRPIVMVRFDPGLTPKPATPPPRAGA